MKSRVLACMIALALTTTNISVLADAKVNADNTKSTKVSRILTGTLETEINLSMPIVSTEKSNLNLKLFNNNNEVNIPLSFSEITLNNTVNLNGFNINYTIEKLAIDKTIITDSNDRVYYYNIKFTNLPCDTYSLELSGNGFKSTVVDNIDILSYSKKVYMNDKESFLLGDINNDGTVSEEDYNEVLNNIDSTNSKYDLNGDGSVDITDLSYVHENLGRIVKEVKIINTNPIIDASKFELIEKEGQTIQGSLEDILYGENIMTISSDKEVSEDNPLSLEMVIDTSTIMEEIVIKSPIDGMGISKGYIEATTEDGEVIQVPYQNNILKTTTSRENNTISINLGKQVAIKKVTIFVTETTQTANLVEISKVEFVNNTKDMISKPDFNIPTIQVASGNESLKVTWNQEANVTGYEVKVTGMVKGTIKEFVTQTSHTKATFNNLENFNEYKVSIQSLNGDWKSGYSNEVTAIPMPTEKPKAPEGITIEDGYKSLVVNWKDNKNAKIFNIYYRKANTDDKFIEIKGISGTSYTLTNLDNETEYEVYLTATNDIGTSDNSPIHKGTTKTINPPVTPNYKLINTVTEGNPITDHIIDVEYPMPSHIEGYGTTFNKFNIVDGDYGSHWTHKDWDTSVYGHSGPKITFDQEYTLDTITLIARQEPGYTLPYTANVGVWNESINDYEYVSCNISRKNNNGDYVVLNLDKPVTTNKIQVNISVYGGNLVSISELKFYHYDSLEDDVRNLFTDDLLIELAQDTNIDKINTLRARANEIDPISEETHPNRDAILNELQLAEDLLNDNNISADIITVNQNINNSGNNLGMLNDYQSLGISVRANEEIVVYVGTTGNVIPQLVFTQHYAESGNAMKTYNLKKGKNVIQVPSLSNMDVEKGGSVYIRYPNSNPSNNEIKVRVSGGYKIPSLNIYGELENETLAKDKIKSYISDLKTYVNSIENNYDYGIFRSKKANEYAYDEKTSVLNTTDIETTKVTLNLPATAILDGITSDLTTEEEEVERVYKSLLAFEQIMDIVYAQRGVSSNEGTAKEDLAPRSRINIKYQRMFDGAFMYASGTHIGIEYGSVAALMQGKPFVMDENGLVTESGKLFGWGIAHEIGHVTEIPKLTYVEATNNIIALLAQTFDDIALSRLEINNKYDEIYSKVTSNTVGMPSDVFMILGMFWQLHLGYDENPTSQMLTNENFYGELSKRYRRLTKEESALDTEQLMIRIVSEVAKKDLSDFFKAWGIISTDETTAYLESLGLEKETRKIQYLNDEARRQVLSGNNGMSENTTVIASYKDGISKNTIIENKDITINLGVSQDEDSILGYEIIRNGEVIGFTTENTFTDNLGSINNRVVDYSVKAYDYKLNATAEYNLGAIKVSHSGVLAKDSWAIETNTISSEDKNDEEICHGPILNPAINKVIDGDNNTSFVGTKSGKEDPYVIIDMNSTESIVGIKYTELSGNAIDDYEVYVSKDKTNWTLVQAGTFNVDQTNTSETIYFNKEDSSGGKQLYTHEANYVKLVAKNTNSITLSELDIIAPPGDNINIGTTEGNYTDGIGILKSDYVYDKESGAYIPQGSIIITGEYRGNPGYNVAVLRDEYNNIISGEQLLLAEIPEDAHIGEISKGTFMYWITPENVKLLTSKIKIEMYRVNNAETNEGQRLVSDSLYVSVPTILPEIEFKNEENLALYKAIERE